MMPRAPIRLETERGCADTGSRRGLGHRGGHTEHHVRTVGVWPSEGQEADRLQGRRLVGELNRTCGGGRRRLSRAGSLGGRIRHPRKDTASDEERRQTDRCTVKGGDTGR